MESTRIHLAMTGYKTVSASEMESCVYEGLNNVAIFIVYNLLAGGKMATKKKVSTSKVAKISKPKKAVKKVSLKKQKELKSGSHYKCGVCGLAVTVDEVCGCADFCDIICCGEQMKLSK